MERERLEKKKKLEQDKLDGEKGSANKVNFHHTINFHWSLFIQVFSFTYDLLCVRISVFLDLNLALISQQMKI